MVLVRARQSRGRKKLARHVRDCSAAERKQPAQQSPRAPCQERGLDISVRLLTPWLASPCACAACKAGKGFARVGPGVPKPESGWRSCASHRLARPHRPRPPRRPYQIHAHQLAVLVRAAPTLAQLASLTAARPRRDCGALAAHNLAILRRAGLGPRRVRRVLVVLLRTPHMM